MSLQSAMYLVAIGLLLLALVEAERRDWLRAALVYALTKYRKREIM